jgi:hypothetical protein
MPNILNHAKLALALLAVAAAPVGAAFAEGNGSSFGQSFNSSAGSSPGGGLIGGAPTAPGAGQAMFTARGPAITTGNVGGMQTTTLPGGAGQGLLRNNGNGTSTLTGPGGSSTTVPTPR